MLKWRRASSRRSTHPPPDGCEPDTRPTGAEDQQFTKMGVASLADPAEPLFAVEYSLGTKPIRAAKWRLRRNNEDATVAANAVAANGPTVSTVISGLVPRIPSRPAPITPRQQAGHMTASDCSCSSLPKSLQTGGHPHMIALNHVIATAIAAWA
jgi:hypothetical protein